jgi:hypothetical protein
MSCLSRRNDSDAEGLHCSICWGICKQVAAVCQVGERGGAGAGGLEGSRGGVHTAAAGVQVLGGHQSTSGIVHKDSTLQGKPVLMDSTL